MKILKSLDRAVGKAERILVIASLALMVLLTFLNIILRTLYSHAHLQWANNVLGQVDWTEPFVRLLVLWITFLGASLITGENRHIRIDVVGSFISSRWSPYREIILSIGCLIICSLMLKASIEYIGIEMDFGSYLFLMIPSWICQLIIPAGFSMMIFRFFIRAIEQALKIRRSRGL
jgi:TRAP-type C4-dicarboxylate transport system permease small subunit